MRKLTATFFIAPLFFSGLASASESISLNAGVTNNYLWRGLEQTNGKAAVSAGIDYAADSGFYLGTWASNATWSDGMTYELDVYGGYAGEAKHFSYDIGYIYYAYPDAVDDVDFSEVYGSITFGAFTIAYATLASAEGADFGDDSYLSADAEIALSNDYALTLHIGTGTDEFYAGEKFVDYSATLSKGSFSFGLSNTDLDDDDLKVVVSYAFEL